MHPKPAGALVQETDRQAKFRAAQQLHLRGPESLRLSSQHPEASRASDAMPASGAASKTRPRHRPLAFFPPPPWPLVSGPAAEALTPPPVQRDRGRRQEPCPLGWPFLSRHPKEQRVCWVMTVKGGVLRWSVACPQKGVLPLLAWEALARRCSKEGKES